MLGCPRPSILRVLSGWYELLFLNYPDLYILRLINNLHSIQFGYRSLSGSFLNIHLLEFEFEDKSQVGLSHSPRIGHFVSY